MATNFAHVMTSSTPWHGVFAALIIYRRGASYLWSKVELHRLSLFCGHTSMWRLCTDPLRVRHQQIQQNTNTIALSCQMSQKILLAWWSHNAAGPHQWFDILTRCWGYFYTQALGRWQTTHSSIKICFPLLRRKTPLEGLQNRVGPALEIQELCTLDKHLFVASFDLIRHIFAMNSSSSFPQLSPQ